MLEDWREERGIAPERLGVALDLIAAAEQGETMGKSAKTVWGYEATAYFGGKPGGLVRPPMGALWASRAAIYASTRSRAGTIKIKRVRATVLVGGFLAYAAESAAESAAVSAAEVEIYRVASLDANDAVTAASAARKEAYADALEAVGAGETARTGRVLEACERGEEAALDRASAARKDYAAMALLLAESEPNETEGGDHG